jgi:hypothetical protein
MDTPQSTPPDQQAPDQTPRQPPKRDAKGKFLKGHKYSPKQRRKPGEMIVAHPFYPDRDIHGNMLPGHSPRSKGPVLPKMKDLKQASIDNVTPDMVQRAMKMLFDLAHSEELDPKFRIEAMKLWLIRAIGEPVKETSSTAEVQKTELNVTVDASRQAALTQLSDQELAQWEAIQHKLQTEQDDAIPVEFKRLDD